MAVPVDGYLLCTTPRTGSTLLCALLQSSGVAGRPASYFRPQDTKRWAARWGVSSDDFGAYVAAARRAGSSGNGVFAARLMWDSLAPLTHRLRQSGAAGGDRDVLTETFGQLRFVYLERGDRIAQAISRTRAEQTQLWHITDESAEASQRGAVEYDAQAITRYLEESRAHNAAWAQWFERESIEPLTVRYEALEADPVGVTHQLLVELGLPAAGVRLTAHNVRMADDVSVAWQRRYVAERHALRGSGNPNDGPAS